MKKLLLVLLIIGYKYTHAQSAHIKFDHFTVKDGLPERQVRFIKQDNLGYIWIGTQNGLVRYDGYKPKVYRFGVDKDAFYQTCSAETMVIDNDNTMWVSTFGNGLFRYDRQADKFIQYKYAQPGKKLTRVELLSFTDSKNNLWSLDHTFPGSYVGISKFDHDKQQFEYFNPDQKGPHHLDAQKCLYITKASDGTIWLGTSEGLYSYNYNADQFRAIPLEELRHDTISRIYEAPSENGVLWLNKASKQTKEYVIVRLDTRTKTVKYFSDKTDHQLNKGNDTINAVLEDSKHRLWFATPKGLLFFDRQTSHFTRYLTADGDKSPDKDEMHSITEGKDSTLWLAAAAGLITFDPATRHFQRYINSKDDPKSLSGGRITTMAADRSGSLFFAVRGEGLNKNNATTSAFITVATDKNNPHSYPGGETSQINSLSGGGVLFSNANGIYKWEPGAANFQQVFKAESSNNTPYALTGDDKGILYFLTTTDGFTSLDTKTGKLKKYLYSPKDPNAIPSNSLTKIFQDHLGIVWIGTDNMGICSFDPATQKFTKYPFITNNGSLQSSNGKLDDMLVLSIFEDKDNTLWVGTNLGGLNRFDRKTGKFTSYLTDGKTRAFSVVSICQDHNGMLWLGTYLNGVFEFDPKSGHFIKSFNEDNGLLFNSTNAVNADAKGNIWVSSERGLSRIDGKDKSVKNFPVQIFSGMASNSRINNIALAGDQLVMDTRESITYFNPDDLIANPYPPAVHIETIGYSDPQASTDSATVLQTYGSHGIELPHNENRVTFNYVALHFADPSQNKYTYTLEGYDTHWTQAGTQRSVTYTNLAPGTYTFRVKASNGDGVWNNEGDRFVVIVDSPLWMRWWAWIIYVILFAGAIYGFIAYRSRQLKMENLELEEKVNDRTKQLSAANEELSEKQEEIITQRDQLAETVTELKTTQQQLIQSEKLASLGELTAGIAHEIQNPLNFVNNFSEVSAEMVDELADELKNEKRDRGLEDELLADLKQNLEKITHHGKRADGIVKNMLQHSRAGSGEVQLTDINTMADEYMRLAYHGLRAKDKDFNSATVTNLASDLPKINVIPQDIGRVLLNLFNNAFYAVQQKQRKAAPGYKPEVSVTTLTDKKHVVIKVRDNGTGIPDEIKDKILQPFFTTKPTGEGTGLGLSLSYDIVVKGHGGSISIDTKEGEFTEFTVQLPL